MSSSSAGLVQTMQRFGTTADALGSMSVSRGRSPACLNLAIGLISGTLLAMLRIWGLPMPVKWRIVESPQTYGPFPLARAPKPERNRLSTPM